MRIGFRCLVVVRPLSPRDDAPPAVVDPARLLLFGSLLNKIMDLLSLRTPRLAAVDILLVLQFLVASFFITI